jgi:hypothetical protein
MWPTTPIGRIITAGIPVSTGGTGTGRLRRAGLTLRINASRREISGPIGFGGIADSPGLGAAHPVADKASGVTTSHSFRGSVTLGYLENSAGHLPIRPTEVVTTWHPYYHGEIGGQVAAGSVVFIGAIDAQDPKSPEPPDLR